MGQYDIFRYYKYDPQVRQLKEEVKTLKIGLYEWSS